MQLCNLHRRKQGTVRTIDQFYDVNSSALVCAQNRRRIYWSNFRTRPDGLFDSNAVTDIPQPADRGILLKDILEDEVPEKYYLSQPTTEKIFRLTPDEALAQYIKDDENIQR